MCVDIAPCPWPHHLSIGSRRAPTQSEVQMASHTTIVISSAPLAFALCLYHSCLCSHYTRSFLTSVTLCCAEVQVVFFLLVHPAQPNSLKSRPTVLDSLPHATLCNTYSEEEKIHFVTVPPPSPHSRLAYQTCPSGLFQDGKGEAGIILCVFEDLHFFMPSRCNIFVSRFLPIIDLRPRFLPITDLWSCVQYRGFLRLHRLPTPRVFCCCWNFI